MTLFLFVGNLLDGPDQIDGEQPALLKNNCKKLARISPLQSFVQQAGKVCLQERQTDRESHFCNRWAQLFILASRGRKLPQLEATTCACCKVADACWRCCSLADSYHCCKDVACQIITDQLVAQFPFPIGSRISKTVIILVAAEPTILRYRVHVPFGTPLTPECAEIQGLEHLQGWHPLLSSRAVDHRQSVWRCLAPSSHKVPNRNRNYITHVETGVFQIAALQGEIDIGTWNFHNLFFFILPDEKK